MEHDFDVIIIGAGLSGLYAAHTLLENGESNFLIIEAQNRIGGRVQSKNVNDHVVIDLGGQWISSKQPRISKLVKQFQLQTVSSSASGKNIYNMLGENKIQSSPLSKSNLIGLYELWKTKKNFSQLVKKFPEKELWSSSFLQETDKHPLENWIEQHLKNSESKAYIKTIASEGACLPPDKLSLFETIWGIQSTGSLQNMLSAEEKWIKLGAQMIAENLAKPFIRKLLLDTPVLEIKYTQTHARVMTNQATFSAKKIIMTVPIHITGKISFTPSLPREKEELLQSIPTSFVIKTIVIYSTPFWRKKGLSGSYFSNKGYIQLITDTSTKHAEYGILTLFSTGESASKLSRLSKHERIAEIQKVLTDVFGLEAKHFIHYIEKDWNKETWISGGYGMHFPPGILSKYGQHLRAPVGPIHWAGTETADEWRLYMEGALQSGERAAGEIIDILNHVE